ncbi:MAG: penicillin acylase family protein [Phycisphaerales bacterium]
MPAKRRVLRGVLLWTILVCTALVLSAFAATYLWLRASLPRQSGELELTGLSAPVTVERDDLAVPRISASSLQDAARAQGFIHAQERFFQMDMARRAAAGELSAIVGPATLDMDREARVYRFRKVAREALNNLQPEHRALLDAYTQGVNAGITSLPARLPEYIVLRAQMEPWQPEDSLLAIYSMFRFLNYTSNWEQTCAVLTDALGPEVAAFLTPETTRLDTPQLVIDPDAEAAAMQPLPVPGPDRINLRATQPTSHAPTPTAPPLTLSSIRDALISQGAVLGSNNWAVSATRSKHNRAILTNDMHLGLSLPNVWFRIQLEWPDHRAVGVSLPGAPGLVAGSTNTLAWGFTNVEADVQDLVIIETNPDDPRQYRTPDGWEPFTEEIEHIAVKGRLDSEDIRIRSTRWGPIVDRDHKDRPLALRWTALDPQTANLIILDLLKAKNVDEGVSVARRMFIPAQNVLMADAQGRIAWCVSGHIPTRTGFTGKHPVSWATPSPSGEMPHWSGALSDQDRPCVIDPPSGALFTANGRTLSFPHARLVSTSFSPSDRVSRIGERLRATDTFDEASLFDITLDTRAAPMDFYRDLFLSSTTSSTDPLIARMRASISNWNGHADPDHSAYRALRAFRRELTSTLSSAIESACKPTDPSFSYRWPLSDEAFLRILESRAPNWLPPGEEWSDWPSFLSVIASRSATRLHESNALDATWGDFNQLAVTHPLARGIPILSDLLSLPKDPLPGSAETVRAQGRTFGASERFSVSPADLSAARFSMPAGQSGHPLSPHYMDGHATWAQGLSVPLLSGAPVHTLRLIPAP